MKPPSLAQTLRRSAGRLRHRWSLPYATFAGPPAGGSVSDLFLWRQEGGGTRFVAENTLALLTGDPINVKHRLTFFDADGTLFQEMDWLSSEIYTTIEPGDLGLPLGTFIHATFYERSSLPPQTKALLGLQRAHRGYCAYRRQPTSVWSSVHGNVGGITNGATDADHHHELLARRRRKFLYTPQVHLHNSQTVRLFFLNPCRQAESISIFLNSIDATSPSADPLHTLLVPSLGVRSCILQGKDGYLTCLSRLPMCRPLVFVEEAGTSDHFDVFHT